MSSIFLGMLLGANLTLGFIAAYNENYVSCLGSIMSTVGGLVIIYPSVKSRNSLAAYRLEKKYSNARKNDVIRNKDAE